MKTKLCLRKGEDTKRSIIVVLQAQNALMECFMMLDLLEDGNLHSFSELARVGELDLDEDIGVLKAALNTYRLMDILDEGKIGDEKAIRLKPKLFKQVPFTDEHTNPSWREILNSIANDPELSARSKALREKLKTSARTRDPAATTTAETPSEATQESGQSASNRQETGRKKDTRPEASSAMSMVPAKRKICFASQEPSVVKTGKGTVYASPASSLLNGKRIRRLSSEQTGAAAATAAATTAAAKTKEDWKYSTRAFHDIVFSGLDSGGGGDKIVYSLLFLRMMGLDRPTRALVRSVSGMTNITDALMRSRDDRNVQVLDRDELRLTKRAIKEYCKTPDREFTLFRVLDKSMFEGLKRTLDKIGEAQKENAVALLKLLSDGATHSNHEVLQAVGTELAFNFCCVWSLR